MCDGCPTRIGVVQNNICTRGVSLVALLSPTHLHGGGDGVSKCGESKGVVGGGGCIDHYHYVNGHLQYNFVYIHECLSKLVAHIYECKYWPEWAMNYLVVFVVLFSHILQLTVLFVKCRNLIPVRKNATNLLTRRKYLGRRYQI